MSEPRHDELDRRIVLATQAGLPLVAEPYAQLAAGLGIGEAELLDRLRAMLADGRIRRIGAVPNHYRLGYRSNGMTVWDVPDGRVMQLGEQIGALPFVSHCYRRPRHPPDWPYNLFAMVHGRSRDETDAKAARVAEEIAALLGEPCRDWRVLYSSAILKKTGLRLAG